jgi:cytochrome oxidase Cu insertion factor (SCO1/SenC/PrrC family)
VTRRLGLVGLGLGALALVVLAVGLAGHSARTGNGAEATSLGPGSSGPYRGSEPPVRMRLPDFALRSYRGGLVRAHDLGRGVVVVTFLDTKCREACPIIAAVVAQAFRGLTAEERGRVRAVAITANPHEDTPPRIEAFLRRHRAAEVFDYLVGSDAELARVWKRFYVLSSLESGDANVHSAPVRVYREGTWVATQHAGADLSASNLAHDLRYALRRKGG